MEYRHLGRSGLRVSALSFGSWVTFGNQVDVDAALEMMTAARDAGVNFFDNAEAYAGGRSEEIMGAALEEAGWRRSDLVLSTKIFWGGDGPNDRGLSRKHIVEGLDASLERLQQSYVDLVFCHRSDLYTPMEETVRAMTNVIDEGKAFYWGTSEWSAEQIREAHAVARREHLIAPTMEQPQYNMFHRRRLETEYARLYDTVGLGTTVWSPLDGGLLTGKYNEGVPDDSRATVPGYEWFRHRVTGDDAEAKIQKVRELTAIAEEIGCTMAQLALAWTLTNPRVTTTITGASRVEQVRENMGAMDVLPKLTTERLARIEAILDNRPDPIPDERGE